MEEKFINTFYKKMKTLNLKDYADKTVLYNGHYQFDR